MAYAPKDTFKIAYTDEGIVKLSVVLLKDITKARQVAPFSSIKRKKFMDFKLHGSLDPGWRNKHILCLGIEDL